jgi:alpha-tubulin suppressor-like RCC1 family protein
MGNDQYGQLGNDTTEPYSDTPVEATVLPADSWKQVATAGATAYALDTDGNVYAWGDNTYGQIGDGATGGDDLTPELVATGVSQVSSTHKTVAVIKAAAGSS